jgi:hypothetical protein
LLRQWTQQGLPVFPGRIYGSALPGTPKAESWFPGKVHCIFYGLPLENDVFPHNMVVWSGFWAVARRFVGVFRYLLMAD